MPCKDAFAYLPARIPDGATNLRCRSHGVLDETFQATFRMPRADLDTWVAESFPDRKPPVQTRELHAYLRWRNTNAHHPTS
ncbi:hypothetical protein [Streptomyces sp. NPDC085540]|uniref:hypothetical protein n=1 Tax=Streptomyces sp. NPDC085540 TaxID=3365730 RepID=UPI0037D068DB